MGMLEKLVLFFKSGPPAARWALVVSVIAVVSFVVGGLAAGVVRGDPWLGFLTAGRRVRGLFRDLLGLSPRRIWALSRHCIMESIRKKLLLVFCIFGLLFLFAGWFLPAKPTEQVKVYVSFVMLSTTLLVLLAMGLQAAMSLPGDIKHYSIFTIVTKPARRIEIILGRILGFTLVATAVLVIMGVVSYVYLRRSVGNSIVQMEERLAEAKSKGNTERAAQIEDDLGQIKSRLSARVPVYGTAFVKGGVDVGNETRRYVYVEGNKPQVALWHFENLPVQAFLNRKAIPIEFNFEVFRTIKGEVGKGVVAELTFRNPVTDVQFRPVPFQVKEYYVNQQSLEGTPDRPLEKLFEGCQGKLDIELRCLSSQQFLGVAMAGEPSLYLLLDRASFGLNFAKGMVGVGLRVFLIICVAVVASTFLSGMVAALMTLAVFIGGQSMTHLQGLAEGRTPGGGPMEALIRLIKHENLETTLDPTAWSAITVGADQGLKLLLRVLTYVLPDLDMFNTAPIVAGGFDIPIGFLLERILMAFGYALPLVLFGYFLFETRELAR